MPLVAFVLASYIAGLYAGFAATPVAAAAVIAAALGISWNRGAVVAAALTALAAAGICVARASAGDEAACAARATTRRANTLVTNDSLSPGGFARARLTACDVTVALSVANGNAPAGSTILARGVVVRAQRGLLLQKADIAVVRRSGPLPRMRAATGRAIDRAFGADAPLVRALLIADTRDLSPELRERFAVSGLTHILAVSGSHIAIIALALALAFQIAGVPRTRAVVATVVVSTCYVALIGAPVAAIRSVVMLALHAATRLGQRPTSRWAIVALGAAQAVVSPRVALDAGYQLSVIGAASIICASLLERRLPLDRMSWWARAVLVSLLATIVASIATAPTVAWVFGRVSLVGPLANLAAAPIVAVLQPMLFVAMVFLPVAPVARFIADAAHPLLAAFDHVAMYSASIPHASVDVAPTMTAAIIASILAGAVLVACASTDWHRPALTALAAAALLIWLPGLSGARGMTELHMIDVGQGDAIALRTPHGHWILFDAGGAWRGGDAGRSTVVPYLGHHGGPLDLFVLSHPHTDHVGGAVAALRALHPGAYIDAGFPGAADAYRQSLQTARAEHIPWRRAHPGDSRTIDGVTIRLLAPDSAWTAALIDPNLASVVVLVEVGDVRMLMMGDAERPEEDWLLAHAAGELHADILKVGHHGSATSSSERFLAAVRPRLALVSVGAGNTYHLPSPEIMDRLAAAGAQVLRTDRLGTIVARTDGRRIHVLTAGDEWELSPP